MKTALQGLIGLILAALLLYWVFRDKDPRLLERSLASASWGGLVVGGLLNFAHNHFRILRWRRLLSPVRPGVAYRPMFASVVLGYLITWLVPGRAGEVVRPALLSSKVSLPLGPCLGTVIADRLLDGIAIVLLFALGSVTATFAADAVGLASSVRSTAFGLAAVMVAGLAGLVAVGAYSRAIESRLAAAWAPVRWAGRAALGMARGVESLRSPRQWLPILALSLIAWTTIAVGTWIGIRAAGAAIDLPAVLVLLPMLALGVALPTPGGAGGYHAMMQLGLTQLFGVDPTVAAGAGLLMHLAIVLPVLLVGPVLLYSENVSFADLVQAAKQVRALGAAEAAP